MLRASRVVRTQLTVGRVALAGAMPSARRGARQMSSLEGTKTLQNLKEAFAGESLARMRYLFFAQVCVVKGSHARILLRLLGG